MKPLCLLLGGVVVGWAASGVDWSREAIAQETVKAVQPSAVASSTKDRGVFVSNCNGDKDIYAISGEKGEARRLTDTPDDDIEPCWSPDGQSIAFTRLGSRGSEVFVMNSDGTQPRRLTNHRSWTSAPSWSPDGKKLAYSLWDNDDWEVFIADVESGSATNLTALPGIDTYPNWSPSGSAIAFHCQEGDEWNIYTINVAQIGDS